MFGPMVGNSDAQLKRTHGTRLTEAGFGHFQILAGNRDLLLERIQLGITEDPRPDAA
jgi:hypothetical protein